MLYVPINNDYIVASDDDQCLVARLVFQNILVDSGSFFLLAHLLEAVGLLNSVKEMKIESQVRTYIMGFAHLVVRKQGSNNISKE